MSRTFVRYLWDRRTTKPMIGVKCDIYRNDTGAYVATTNSDANGLVSFSGLSETLTYRAFGLVPHDIRVWDEREGIGGSLWSNLSFVRGYNEPTLADGATINLGTIRGLLLVSNVTDDIVELVVLGTATAVTVAAEGLSMTLNSDAGATYALYTSGGVWLLKNRFGVAKYTRVQIIGN